MSFETQSFQLKNKKSNKNLFDYLERALFILFFTFRSLQRCKMSVQKSPYKSPKNQKCTRQTSFFVIFLLNKISVPIFQIIHIQTRPSAPASMKVLNKDVRSKIASRVFFFGINVEEWKIPWNEVALVLNWMNESWNIVHVRINSALIVLHLVLPSEVSVLLYDNYK